MRLVHSIEKLTMKRGSAACLAELLRGARFPQAQRALDISTGTVEAEMRAGLGKVSAPKKRNSSAPVAACPT